MQEGQRGQAGDAVIVYAHPGCFQAGSKAWQQQQLVYHSGDIRAMINRVVATTRRQVGLSLRFAHGIFFDPQADCSQL